MPNDPATSGDELILAIVHDLRAYLRRGLTGAQLLDRAPTSLADDHRRILSGVIAANKEIERFLGRLSDYANAAHVGTAKPIPLVTALHLASQQFDSGRVLFDTSGDVRVVPPALVRVFTELIDNGLKFSGGETVTIRTGPPGGEVFVTDSGIGVEPGQEERIFEPLVRLHGGDQYPGFGLGLAICRRIATAHSAQVRMVPNPGGGSAAIVTLPPA